MEELGPLFVNQTQSHYLWIVALLAAAGAPVPDTVQGEDLLPWVLGAKRGGPDEILIEQIQPGNTPHRAEWRALRTREHLYAQSGHREQPNWLLYDMADDPYQLHNLAEAPSHRQTAASLAATLGRLRAQTGDTTDLRANYLARRPPAAL